MLKCSIFSCFSLPKSNDSDFPTAAEASSSPLDKLIAEGLKVPAAQGIQCFDIQAVVLSHLASRELADYCKVDRLSGVQVRSQEHFVFFSSFIQGQDFPEGFNTKLLSDRFDLRIKAARERLESAATTPEMRQMVIKRALAEAFFELARGYHQELSIRYPTLGLSHNVALAKHCLEQMLLLSREERLLEDVTYLAKAQLALQEGKSVAAVVYFGQAAGANNAYAKFTLGIAFQLGLLGLPKNETEARKNYQEVAALGCADAKNCLGVAYECGELGLVKDEAAALRLYREAAALGCPGAFNNLGVAYEHGELGLPQDEVAALRLYREAAALGCPGAFNNLGVAYKYGELGLPKDEVAAFQLLYRKAAVLSSAAVKKRLGIA